jgi:hypothetical protein
MACDGLADMYHRPPVIIFLSDGDDDVSDGAIYDICRSAVSQGFVWFHPERCF